MKRSALASDIIFWNKYFLAVVSLDMTDTLGFGAMLLGDCLDAVDVVRTFNDYTHANTHIKYCPHFLIGHIAMSLY